MPNEPTKNKHILMQIFISTLYLSAFTFGGGYVIVTLMKKKFVDDFHWIDETEMLDLIAIAQSSPGAIAVNGAIVVGYKLARIPGVLVAVLGTVLPPFVIISVLSFFYEAFKENIWVNLMLTGMQAGVGAVIAAVVYDMSRSVFSEKKVSLVAIMIAAFVANYIFNVNVIYIVLICIGLGLLQALWQRGRSAA
nr:chromate transporter [Enterococcus timonensis]